MSDGLDHKSDKNLNEEVETFLSNALQARFDEELKQELKEELNYHYNISKKNLPSESQVEKPRRIGYYILAAAAGFALLLIALNLLITSPGNARELAASYLVESEIYHPGALKGVATDQSERQRAIEAFNEKKYAEAEQAFARIEEKTEEDLFYSAICALFLEQYNTAITRLEPLAAAKSNFSPEARWYLAVGYLLNGNEPAAKDLLLKMDASSWNYEKAQQLLKAL